MHATHAGIEDLTFRPFVLLELVFEVTITVLPICYTRSWTRAFTTQSILGMITNIGTSVTLELWSNFAAPQMDIFDRRTSNLIIETCEQGFQREMS